ncbi:MAG: hypothetical protein A2Y12_12185 [Planctomycetes bacterium GWF2_42_9]|nr:MAG: hypothetical protein A2Y12_12185 [Planctomycetes bacterium GWF2_42_9]HAL45184.1 hypothetical protein [Phycisphaerales bacterium]
MEIIGLLIFLSVICLLTGPIALIIAIVALNKARGSSPLPPKTHPCHPEQSEGSRLISRVGFTPSGETPPVPVQPSIEEEKQPEPKPEFDILLKHEKREPSKELGIWEQWIGTRGLLFAGIIVIFFAVGFFLKYAYDNFSMGPQGRVIGVTIFGLITLIVGEITRRRGFGIVAKGVTALGFATLYASVFTAYEIYNLISYIPACTAASIITIAAMIYAVALDEVLIAFLSLLGGFATPVMVLLKVINPAPLFVYILILGVGAMACSYYRKWKTVNLLSFIGTFTLFSIWYYNSSYYNYKGAFTLQEIIFVLSWLAVFFLFYLVMPVFYSLVNRVKSYKQDVLLILANSAATLYYLFTVLAQAPRNYLALSVVILALIFLSFSAIVYKRCRDDVNLRICLHAIGIFCATLAVPLYFKLDATTVTWALEAVVLVYIGMRYSSILTQLTGLIVVGLSIGCLMMNLPLHESSFKLILNIEFAQWLLVSASVFVIHLLYRKNKQLPEIVRKNLSQIFYSMSLILFFASAMMEWYYHNEYNMPYNSIDFTRGCIVIFAIAIQLFVIRPLTPKGLLPKIAAYILAIIAAGYMICNFEYLNRTEFKIFININFLIAAVFIVSLFLAAKFTSTDKIFKPAFAIIGIITLWIILTQEIYLYLQPKTFDGSGIPNWQFLAQMYISIAWAIYALILMLLGFWRNNAYLRYISFLIFGVLLAKIFLVDTHEIKNIYRVAAFLVTGATLVSVSYLYQFLRKNGFFDTLFLNDSEKKD